MISGKTGPELQGEESVSQPQGELHKPDERDLTNEFSSLLLGRVEDVNYGQFTNKQIWNILLHIQYLTITRPGNKKLRTVG